MKIFMFAASLRKDSLNKKLIRAVREMIPKEHDVTLKEFNEFQMPLYDGDIETAEGIPEGAQKLGELISQADAILISSPEYNGGIPGIFKNAIDWTSRAKPVSWNGKQVFLMGATPGMNGTQRGIWHIRKSLELQSAFVFPDMIGVPLADKAFDENGALKEEKVKAQLFKLLPKFLDHAEYMRHKPQKT